MGMNITAQIRLIGSLLLLTLQEPQDHMNADAHKLRNVQKPQRCGCKAQRHPPAAGAR